MPGECCSSCRAFSLVGADKSRTGGGALATITAYRRPNSCVGVSSSLSIISTCSISDNSCRCAWEQRLKKHFENFTAGLCGIAPIQITRQGPLYPPSFYLIVTVTPFGDLDDHHTVSSSFLGIGFEIQVTLEAGNYNPLGHWHSCFQILMSLF